MKITGLCSHLTPQFPEQEPRLTNESKLASVITVHKLQLKVASLIKIQIDDFLLDTNSYLYRCTISVRTCEPFFFCFASVVFLGSIAVISLLPLFYVTGEFYRFLHRE